MQLTHLTDILLTDITSYHLTRPMLTGQIGGGWVQITSADVDVVPVAAESSGWPLPLAPTSLSLFISVYNAMASVRLARVFLFALEREEDEMEYQMHVQSDIMHITHNTIVLLFNLYFSGHYLLEKYQNLTAIIQ